MRSRIDRRHDVYEYTSQVASHLVASTRVVLEVVEESIVFNLPLVSPFMHMTEIRNSIHLTQSIYASAVTRPLGLVTLTPRALALARMSTRLREETAWPILPSLAYNFQFRSVRRGRTQQHKSGCALATARRPWGSARGTPCGRTASCAWSSCCYRIRSISIPSAFQFMTAYLRGEVTHRRHGNVALEPSAHPVVDTLGLAP